MLNNQAIVFFTKYLTPFLATGPPISPPLAIPIGGPFLCSLQGHIVSVTLESRFYTLPYNTIE
jgi:hypothetical protein